MIPRQKQTTEFAAEPRPWQRIPSPRQYRTISHMVRKWPPLSSSSMSASSRGLEAPDPRRSDAVGIAVMGVGITVRCRRNSTQPL